MLGESWSRWKERAGSDARRELEQMEGESWSRWKERAGADGRRDLEYDIGFWYWLKHQNLQKVEKDVAINYNKQKSYSLNAESLKLYQHEL